jgi:DNA polymerase elongation subunit (family B)
MWRGNVLDVHPDYHRNLMVTWLADHGRAVRIEDHYEPRFLVTAPQTDLYDIAAKLHDNPLVKTLDFTDARLTLGSKERTPILAVTPKTLQSLHGLATLVDSWGKYQRYQLYDVDLRLPTRYLEDKGIFSNADVAWDGRYFQTADDRWAIDYPSPAYTSATLSITPDQTSHIPSYHHPIKSIQLDDETIQETTEPDTLLAAEARLHELNPDILFTKGGDSFWFPYLSHRCQTCGVRLHLGRDHWDTTGDVKASKPGKSYMSYGQVMYRPAFYTLQGRAHIDTSSSFLYWEASLAGMIDISRASNIPLQLASRLGPGTAISQIQINTARHQGYHIPWKKNRPEDWKTALDLLNADRGGLMLEPRVGLHENVWELDYASLYPNIMLLHNISPETLNCPCCPDSPHRVPQLGYHICQQHQGLVPSVLRPILHRRFCYKARSKHPDYDHTHYKQLQQAWKWVLIVCFGYTGYRNARYGRIECHESITAYSRDALLTAKETAEHAGYTVLHGIVDSLWIQPHHPTMTIRQLSTAISTKTGIRLAIDGRFHWIVFLPCATLPIGALTHYYGVFDTGELKLRGIEARQHDTPPFLRTTQQTMLQTLATAHTKTQFHQTIPQLLTILHQAADQIRTGTIPTHQLVITSRITMTADQYSVNTLTKAALLQLQDHDITPQPGQTIRYLVTNETSHHHHDRVRIIEAFNGTEHPDTTYYLRQLATCTQSLLSPFGYTTDHLLTHLNHQPGENHIKAHNQTIS